MTLAEGASEEARNVTFREVHRFDRTFGDDPDDLCTYRIVVDLGKNQLFLIEAESRASIAADGTRKIEVEIQDIAPHRGHVNVLK